MKNLYKALSAFQQEVPVIHKGTQGYGYSYADLPTIFEKINPLLKKHGLGFTQLIEGTSIKTVIFHIASEETIESNTEIPQNVSLKGMNEFQVLGSGVSYIRRYSLSSALGLITDKDTDAAAQEAPAKKTAPAKKEAPAKKTKTPEEKHAAAVKKAVTLLKSSENPNQLKENWNKVKEHVGKEPDVVKAKDEMKAKFNKDDKKDE